jgi:hypothetical protein
MKEMAHVAVTMTTRPYKQIAAPIMARYNMVMSEIFNLAGGNRPQDADTPAAELAIIIGPWVFAHPGRSVKNNANYLQSRIELLRTGEWQKLLDQTKKYPRSNSTRDSSARIKKLIEDGDLGGVSKMILSKGIAPINEENYERLKEKHPEAPPVPYPDSFPEAPYLASKQDIASILLAYRDDASVGPMGWTAKNLKHLWKHKEFGFQKGFRAFVNRWLAGTLSPLLAPYFNSAVIIALNKDDLKTDIRPIAIGDLLRRIVHRIAMKKAGPTAAKHFGRLQLGINVSSGCEIIVHSLREYLRYTSKDNDSVILNVDISNAFNTESREAFLSETLKITPRLAPLAFYSYANPSLLIFGSYILMSSCGTQQGDPLGGLLFCLGFHPVLVEANSRHPHLDILLFFFDDGTLAGKVQHVKAAFETIRELAKSKANLDINVRKCSAMKTARVDAMDLEEPAPHVFEGAIPFVSELKTLGVPLSFPLHAHDFSDKYAKMHKFIEGVLSLGNKQVEYLLLRDCGPFHRLVYLMRNLSMSELGPVLADMDKLTEMAMDKIFLGDEHFTEAQRTQAQLKISRGGLGLRDAVRHHDAAFLGASIQVRNDVAKILEKLIRQRGALPVDPAIAAHVARFNTHVAEADRLDLDLLFPPLDPDTHPRNDHSYLTQKVLSERIDRQKMAALRQRFVDAGDLINVARLAGVGARHSGGFLNAPLNFFEGARMDNEQFGTAALFRLGHHFIKSDGVTCNRLHAHPTNVDRLGTHFLVCKAGDQDTIIYKHNAVRDHLQNVAIEAQLHPVSEPSDLIPGSGRKPADILISLNGRQIAVDVTIANSVHPLPQTAATIRAGTNARKKEAEKRLKYQAALNNARIDCRPFAMETYGALAPSASSLLDEIATRIAQIHDVDLPSTKKRLYVDLSIVLQRSNAVMMNNRVKAHHALGIPPPH